MCTPCSLQGKTILVTGASSGIGRETAIACSEAGARVILTGRNEQRLAETYASLKGGDHLQIAADTNDEEQFVHLVNALPPVQGAAFCAGIVTMTPFLFISRQEMENIFNTNFFSPVLLAQKLIKAKKVTERKYHSIRLFHRGSRCRPDRQFHLRCIQRSPDCHSPEHGSGIGRQEDTCQLRSAGYYRHPDDTNPQCHGRFVVRRSPGSPFEKTGTSPRYRQRHSVSVVGCKRMDDRYGTDNRRRSDPSIKTQ